MTRLKHKSFPPVGELRRSPDPLVRWGGGYLLPISHSVDALGVSLLIAFGASILAPVAPCMDS